MPRYEYMRRLVWVCVAASGCYTVSERVPDSPEMERPPIDCSRILAETDLGELCGFSVKEATDEPPVTSDMICNRKLEGTSKLQNLQLVVTDDSVRKPYLVHTQDSDELSHFKTLDVGKGGSRWTRRESAGTYALNLEFITDDVRVLLTTRTWEPGDPEKSSPGCSYPELEAIAPIIEERLKQ